MRERLALLLDGGFVRVQLRRRLRRPLSAEDVVALVRRMLAAPELLRTRLLRVYFYDAPPLRGTRPHPVDGTPYDFGRHHRTRENQELIDRLAIQPNFAVRRGELQCVGWRLNPELTRRPKRGPLLLTADDVVPDVRQKGVDLRIGLDIAWIALRRLADIMVVATGDADSVPAFKFARREGLRVHLETLGHAPPQSLREHSDVVMTTVPGMPPERSDG